MIDKSSYKLLKKLYRKGELTITEAWAVVGHADGDTRLCPQVSALMAERLVAVTDYADENERYVSITVAGRAVIEQRRRDGRIFWVPYLITTFVALASLAVSLFSALQKAG